MLAARGQPLLAGRSRQSSASAPPVRAARSHGPKRAALQVVSYRTEVSEKLLKNAQQYARITGAAGSMSRSDLSTSLEPLIGPHGITFLADHVIYPHDRTKDVGSLVDSLSRQHAAYEHQVYRPVVSAVNEEAGVVFTAIYYVLRNRGPLLDVKEPTGRISKGFLIDKMTFDKNTGRLVSSLVTRQLTAEERDSLLEDPSSFQPAVVNEGELVAVPNVVAGPNDYKYMGEMITQWDSLWSSEAPLDQLNKVLDPNCRAHDGYGLSNKPNGILWQGVNQARDTITSSHKTYESRSQLVSYAVSYEHKIRDIYEFCMKEYPLRHIKQQQKKKGWMPL
ncbi:hypothetical protein PLESTF_000335700 [Pleodorina starrii]|nr:hypothetical protein PLESTM_001578000 [Pleodorina starrii]GLC65747.1 hypothetical protein PLESTF_000335700 [Pleodorina starrii]